VTEHAEDHPSRIHRRNAEWCYSFRNVGMYRAVWKDGAIAFFPVDCPLDGTLVAEQILAAN
jgi:hypothetical protein